jgi:plasmid replication initiation protein
MEQKAEKKIKKANMLIEARYKHRYTLHEQKTIIWILSNISNTNIMEEQYGISIKDYAGYLNISPNHIYKEAKKIAVKLVSKALQIKEENGWIVCSWFSCVRYDKGILYLSVCPQLKPYLLHLKELYTTYQLRNVLILTSIYAIRVYELLVQYLKIGYREIMLDDLREMLGIQSGELKQFVHFRDKALVRAEKEINEKTDISFTWKSVKTCRKIISIKFFIKSKQFAQKTQIQKELPKHMLEQVARNKIKAELENELKNIGFNEKELFKLIEEVGVDKIEEKYGYLKFHKETIRRPKQWLINAIRNDYNVGDMFIEQQSEKNNELREKMFALKRKITEYRLGVESAIAQKVPTYKKQQESLLANATKEFKQLEKECPNFFSNERQKS